MKKVSGIENQLKEVMEDQMAFCSRTEFWHEEKSTSLDEMSKMVKTLQQATEDRFQQVEFKLTQRVSINDMKQNFDILNDILQVKFRQVEDTKEAVRSVIAYQKYYHGV